jgi:hypothetical protein
LKVPRTSNRKIKVPFPDGSYEYVDVVRQDDPFQVTYHIFEDTVDYILPVVRADYRTEYGSGVLETFAGPDPALRQFGLRTVVTLTIRMFPEPPW